MSKLCRFDGVNFSACALTASTGLSLAETVVRRCSSPAEAILLIGPATSFFSYSWTGTKVGDMLDSILRVIVRLEAEDGKARFTWIDMFCASQNLLAGAYLPEGDAAREALKASDKSAFRARKEDTDRIFDGAIDAVDEILFYFSHMSGQWDAPPHPFLLAERGDTSPPMRNERWVRCGPGALSRAWCLMELSKALAKGCTLHLTLNASDLQTFEWLIETQNVGLLGDNPTLFQEFMATVEVRDAQISKLEDRDFVLSVIDKLDGGIGEINAKVMESFRKWMFADMRSRLARLPAHERDLSPLSGNLIGALLQASNMPEDADQMLTRARGCLAAHKQAHGERAVSTREAAFNLVGALVQHGTWHGLIEEAEEAEATAREGLEIERQLGADAMPRIVYYGRSLLGWSLATQAAALMAKGEAQVAKSQLAEAETLCSSVLKELEDGATLKRWDAAKGILTDETSHVRNLIKLFAGYSLAAVLRAMGRLDEAAAVLKTALAVADADEKLDKNFFGWRAKALDAVLRHEMSGDVTAKAEAKADLEKAYIYMREHLGKGNWWVQRCEAQMKGITSGERAPAARQAWRRTSAWAWAVSQASAHGEVPPAVL